MSLENSKKKTKDRLLTVTGRHVGSYSTNGNFLLFTTTPFTLLGCDADRPRCDSNLV